MQSSRILSSVVAPATRVTLTMERDRLTPTHTKLRCSATHRCPMQSFREQPRTEEHTAFRLRDAERCKWEGATRPRPRPKIT